MWKRKYNFDCFVNSGNIKFRAILAVFIIATDFYADAPVKERPWQFDRVDADDSFSCKTPLQPKSQKFKFLNFPPGCQFVNFFHFFNYYNFFHYFCISWKFDHQVAPLALVSNLATRWRHLYWLKTYIWPLSGTNSIFCKFGQQVVPLALVKKLADRWRHLY